MANAAVKRYWSKLAADGCLICGGPAEIAHCHGGSIVERMQEPKAKGKKLARYDWLVLPLCAMHHRLSEIALDCGTNGWENLFGRQADFIDGLANKHGLDLWGLAAPTKQTPAGKIGPLASSTDNAVRDTSHRR